VLSPGVPVVFLWVARSAFAFVWGPPSPPHCDFRSSIGVRVDIGPASRAGRHFMLPPAFRTSYFASAPRVRESGVVLVYGRFEPVLRIRLENVAVMGE